MTVIEHRPHRRVRLPSKVAPERLEVVTVDPPVRVGNGGYGIGSYPAIIWYCREVGLVSGHWYDAEHQRAPEAADHAP